MATPEDRIKEILGGLAKPTQQPGLLQRILGAIPQALSVGFSQDPAQALQVQLSQQAQRAQQEQQRQQEIAKLGATLQIEDILARAREQRAEEATVRAEQRGEATQIAKEKRQQEFAVEDFNRQLSGQKEIEGLKSDLNIKLAKVNADENLNLAQVNNQYAVELENLRNSNETSQKKLGAIINAAYPIVFGGYMEPEKAYEMFNKIATTGKIDPKDSAALNKAIKAKEASERSFELKKVYAHAAASRQRDPQESIIKFAEQFAKSERLMWVKDPKTGQRKLTEYVTGGVTNEPIVPQGFVFDGLADYQERLNHGLQLVAPLAKGFSANQAGQRIEGTNEQVKGALLDQFLQTPGLSNAQKMQALSDPNFQQQQGITQDMINQAMKRNNITLEQQPDQSAERLRKAQLINQGKERITPIAIPLSEEEKKVSAEKQKKLEAAREQRRKEKLLER